MFVQMERTLPPSAVLPILGAQAPSLCAPYLEIALANGSADPADYHNELARIYLRMVLNKEKMLRMRGSAGVHPTALADAAQPVFMLSKETNV